MCVCEHIAFLVHAINDATEQMTEAPSCAKAAAGSPLSQGAGSLGVGFPHLEEEEQAAEVGGWGGPSFMECIWVFPPSFYAAWCILNSASRPLRGGEAEK